MSRKDKGNQPIRQIIGTPKNAPMIARSTERNAPSVGIFDEPTRCYRVNHEWAAHIAGAVSTLTEVAAWIGADDERHSAIQSILQFLQGTVCDVIDCNDIDDCLDTADMIATIAAVSYGSQEANTQAHFDDLNTAYDGTAQSIGASIPTTAPNLNSLQDNALCAVLTRIIRVYAGSKGAGLTLLTDLQRWYQDMIQSMRDIFKIVPNYLWYLVGDDLFGCVTDVAAALIVLGDSEAIEEFGCCLREELRGVGMSQSNWDAAIATCIGSLTGNAGDLACLFDGDNSLDHYLSFLEAYNGLLERQIAGEDFVCFCVPDGWFWLDVNWDWIEPTHSGNRQSPVFTHTNPSNGELFSVTARFQSDNPAKTGIRASDTGLGDTLVTTTPLKVGTGLRLWENSFIGVFEGADAVGWPAAQRKDTSLSTARRQPDATFTFRWADNVDLGHSASAKVSHVRLLYKIVP